MYYRISESYDEKTYTDATVTNMSETMGFKITSTMPLGNDFPVLNLLVKSDNLPGDYFMSGPFLIISRKLKMLFDKNRCKFEYFDVAVSYRGSKFPLGNFYYAHLLNEEFFIDDRKSIYSLDEGYIDDISTIVIDKKKISNEPIMSLSKSFELVVIVNNTLAEDIINNKISGVDLNKVS